MNLILQAIQLIASVLDSPRKITFPIIYVPRESIWEQIIASLIGVLVGSGLTWFLTKRIEDEKSNRSFILDRQQSCYLPLLEKIDTVANKSYGDLISFGSVGVYKDPTPDITTDNEWMDMINALMDETKPKHQVNYTKKLFMHVLKTRHLFERYIDGLNKRMGELIDMMYDLVHDAAIDFERANAGNFEHRFMRMNLNPQFFFNQLLGINDNSVFFLEAIEYLHKDSSEYKEYKYCSYINNIVNGYNVEGIDDENDHVIVRLIAWITSEIRRSVPTYLKLSELIPSPLVTMQGKNYCIVKEKYQKECRRLYLDMVRDIKKEASEIRKLVFI